MYTLVIDTRERDLIKLATEAGAEFTIEQLEIGDIIFRGAAGNQDCVMIERKTINDLRSSICDGRLREQKIRMLNSDTVRKNNIMYLIEGSVPDLDTPTVGGVGCKSVVGSMINMMFRDDLKVYKTRNIKETLNYIIRLYDKLNDKSTVINADSSGDQSPTDTSYSKYIKTKKIENITPRVFFVKSLCIIPRVSYVIADSIAVTYLSYTTLVNTYAGSDEQTNLKLLSDITYNTTAGKVRKIGPVLSKRIYEFVSG